MIMHSVFKNTCLWFHEIVIFTQNISFGELYNTYKISKSNAVSVNAQILKTAVDLDFNFFKKI